MRHLATLAPASEASSIFKQRGLPMFRTVHAFGSSIPDSSHAKLKYQSRQLDVLGRV